MSIKHRAGDFSLFLLFILIFCFSCVSTAPIVQSYNKFFSYVTSHKCYLPKNIKPFTPSAVGWFFLSEPLKQCNGADATYETKTLCAEIFENFINTTCNIESKLSLPKFSSELSSKVCVDFSESDAIIPKIKDYVGGKLSDRTVCQLVCASQYEILCKVLLWSYQVRHHIGAASNTFERQNDLNPPVQNIKLNPVTENQIDLKSSIKAQDEQDTTQREVNSVENPNDFVKQAFDDHRRLIPVFSNPDNENQLSTAKAEMKVEVSSTAMKHSSFTDNNKINNDDVARNNENVNELENIQNLQLSSQGNSNVKAVVDETIAKNQNALSNVENAILDNTAHDLLKSKLKEKLKKHQTPENIVVNNVTATSHDLKINTNEDVFQLGASKNLPNNEGNQPELKDIQSINDNINNVENSLSSKLVTEPSKEFKEREKVEHINLPNQKNVSSTSSTTRSSEKEVQHNLDSGISIISSSTKISKPTDQQNSQIVTNDKETSTEIIKPSDQQNSQIVSNNKETSTEMIKPSDQQNSQIVSNNKDTSAKISEPLDQQNSQIVTNNKDTTSSAKIEVKNTIESQDKDINLISESNDGSNLETTTLKVALEEMDDANEIPPPVQGQDQYNDLENGDTEGEYDRSDYAPDGALPPSTENKKVVAQDSFITSEKTAEFNDQQNDFSKLYDVPMPKNFGGQVSEDIRRIPPFPEEEDGHFFFYFLSVILILMIGYLIFHNKQKIIALIVEGRHERRRRSYGAGYKKLETK